MSAVEKKSLAPTGIMERYPHFVLLLLTLAAYWVMALYKGESQNATSWITMTMGGIGAGAMLFIMASGMSLSFGLMGVMNLGHGAFITIGAYFGVLIIGQLADWYGGSSGFLLFAAVALAVLFAMVFGGLAGFAFERVLIRPVYNDHMKQILVTVGGGLVIVELLVNGFGPDAVPLAAGTRPQAFFQACNIPLLGDACSNLGLRLEPYRLYMIGVGLALFWLLVMMINKTKVGLLIRAGVENPKMVEAHGYNIKMLFIAVFVAGTALAAAGGVLWSITQGGAERHIGDLMLVDVIIVIIIGGLGSISGCFWASIIIGVLGVYMQLFFPSVAVFTKIGLLVAVLMWRPQGLIPVIKG